MAGQSEGVFDMQNLLNETRKCIVIQMSGEKATTSRASKGVFSYSIGMLFGVTVFLWLGILRSYFVDFDFSDAVSFIVDDYPGNLQSECSAKSFGKHFFGDLWSIWCHSKLGNPYLSDVGTNYFPFAYVILRPFLGLIWWLGPFWTMTILVTTAAILLFRASVLFLSGGSELNPELKGLPYVVTFVTFASAPFISLFDRGNIQVIVFISFVLGVIFLERRWINASLLCFAVGSAIKGYPGFFALALLTKSLRSGSVISKFITTTIVLTVVALFYFDGSFFDTSIEMFRDIFDFDSAERRTHQYNHSLTGSVRAVAFLSDQQIVHSLADFIASIWFRVSLILLLLILSALERLTVTSSVSIGAFIGVALTPLAAAYSMSMWIVVLPFLLRDLRTRSRSFELFLLGVLLAPKGVLLAEGVSLSSLLDGFLQLGLLTWLCISDLRYARRNGDGRKASKASLRWRKQGAASMASQLAAPDLRMDDVP